MRRSARLFLPVLVASLLSTAAHAQDAGPVLTPPRLLESPAVSLPEGAEPLPPDSSVQLTITISAEGRVVEAQLFEPLRDDVDALVLEAARSMVFEPATRDGEPIAARVRFRYHISPPAPPPEENPEPPPEEPPGGEETPEPAEVPDDAVDASEMETDVPILGVTAEAEHIEAGAAERITLRAEELTTVPGTFGEPLRVVATLPGVVRSPFGLGFFLVRGANFQNTGFMVDGFTVPLLYHLGAGPAVISSRLVTELNFYPGGYPANYGRFSAGLVSVVTGPPPTDRVRGELEVDLFRASAMVVVPFDDGKGSVAAAFRRSYFELLLPLVAPGINLNYTDYQIRGDYQVDNHMQLSLFFFGSDDQLDQSGSFGGGTASEGVQNAIAYDFQRLIGSVRLRLPHDVRMRIAGMLGRDGNSFSSSQPGSDPLSFAIQTQYAGLRVDTEIPWEDWLQTNVGLDINASILDVSANAFVPTGLGEYPRPLFTPQSSSVDLTVVRALGALYLDTILRLAPFEISLSGRFDYMRYGDVSEIYPDPRMVVRWQVVPELKLKAATGLFSQPPNTFQLVRTGGNPLLQPERSWQTSAGAELTLPESIEIHSTFFYTDFFDLVQQVNRVEMTEQGPQRVYFANEGSGRAYGMELMVRRRVDQGLYGWLSYTLSRSERLSSSGAWTPFVFDQTHTLNFAVSYAFEGWRFGAAFQMSTGRVTNTLVRTTYDADEDSFDPTFRSFGDRLPYFTRLDLRIDRDFEIGPISGSVYIDVQNVYNASNNEGIVYSYDYTQQSTIPGLPILPTIGIRGIIR